MLSNRKVAYCGDTFLGLEHTARTTMGVGMPESRYFQAVRGKDAEGGG